VIASVSCRRVRDLSNRLRAEKRSLDQLRRAAAPREKEPKLRAQLDELAERVRIPLWSSCEGPVFRVTSTLLNPKTAAL